MPRPHSVFTSVHDRAVPMTEIECVKEQIVSYETLEAKIVKKYGIPGNVDSAAILQAVKDTAWNSADPQYLHDEIVRDAKVLDDLLKLRCRLEQLQVQGFLAPRLPNSREQLPKPMDPEPSPTLDPDRSWGVIIGIDAYQTSPLRGCVSDAQTVNQYLVHILGVPESHIQLLLARHGGLSSDTSWPSRVNIIESLLSIYRNPLVQKGDNIIIYFSGHGTSYHCSYYFPNSGGVAHFGAIEAICPVDRYSVDANGCLIPDISDRELNTILHLIRVEKGENITVITDCCYAGGVTRGIPSSLPHGTTRSLPPFPSGLELMLRAGDENLKGYFLPKTVSVLAESWSPLNASHILLAACTDFQLAREVEKDDGTVHGIFTEALISTLKAGPRNQSYSDLCFTISTAMDATGQTPSTIGENRNKVFPWYPRV